MSVFSRIFQKNPPRDSKRPQADEPEAKTDGAAPKNSNHAPAPEPTPSTPPKRSMRPVAPLLEMRSERPPNAPTPPVQQPAVTNHKPPANVVSSKAETTLVYASPPDPAAPPSAPRPAAPAASPQRAPAPPKAAAPAAPRATAPTLPDRSKPPARKPAPSSPKLDEVDAAFGAIVDKNPKSAAREYRRNEVAAAPPPDVRELFVAIAANHMRPLRDIMIGLKWGDPLSSPGAICSPIVTSLMSAAREMGFAELTQGLGAFASVLSSKAGGEGALDGAAREAVLSAYAKLSTHMPDVFALEGEQGRREAVIVHSLLRQIPQVSHLAMQRLYAAGLANLDMMLLAKSDAITSIAGVENDVASRIVDKFQTYRRETREAPPGAGREKERERLASLAADLRRLHQSHEKAATGWGDDAAEAKKKLRHARNEVFMQVKVLLARLGELERLRELETMSFQGRIDRLEAYLLENGAAMNNGGRG
jgi:hypothetical protein